MGTISRPYSYSDGAKARPSQANANENTLYDEINGKLDWDNLDSSLANAANGLVKLDADGLIPASVMREGELAIFLPGNAYVGTFQAGWLAKHEYTIGKVYLYAETAPSGADLIVDVNKNGTTIFTTQANRPKISDGNNSGSSGTPDVTSLSDGDRLSFDVDQVGSSTPGGDPLYITVLLKRA